MGFKTKNGGNLCQLYPLQEGWVLGTLPIMGSGESLNMTFNTAITGHEKSKNLQAVITHERFDTAFTENFLKEYIWESEPESGELYEDGTDASGSVSNPSVGGSKVGLAIIYSGKSNEATPKRYVRAFPFRLTGGGYTMEANTTIRPETTLVGVKAGGNIAITSGIFLTSLVTGATAMTISADTYGSSVWMTAVGN